MSPPTVTGRTAIALLGRIPGGLLTWYEANQAFFLGPAGQPDLVAHQLADTILGGIRPRIWQGR